MARQRSLRADRYGDVGLGTREPYRSSRGAVRPGPVPLACAGCTTSTTCAAATSCSSAGATPTTPRAAARSGTSRRWRPGLVARGCRVTIFCAAHAAAPPDEVVDGVRFVRRGSKLVRLRAGACCAGAWPVRHRRPGRRRAERAPLLLPPGHPGAGVVLVHHVHREQWPVVYTGRRGQGRLVDRAPARAVALPALPVRRGLARHPRRAPRGSASAGRGSRSCTTAPTRWCTSTRGKAADPTLAVVGRLVPHKQVEHAIDAVARAPGRAARAAAARRRQRLVGGRAARLRRGARRRRLVSCSRARSTRSASTRSTSAPGCCCCPRSRRAGAWSSARPACTRRRPWPTARAGGTRESIADRRSGVLVDDPRRVHRTRCARCCTTSARRTELGAGALRASHDFTWPHAQQAFALVVAAALRGEPVDSQDPEELDDVMQDPA